MYKSVIEAMRNMRPNVIPLLLTWGSLIISACQAEQVQAEPLVFTDGYRPAGWIENGSELVFVTWPDVGDTSKDTLTPHIISLDSTGVARRGFDYWDVPRASLSECALFSPDGDSMLTIKNDAENPLDGGVFTVNKAGQTSLSIPGYIYSCPALSYDDRFVAVVLSDSGQYTLRISGKDGQTQNDILSGRNDPIDNLAWLPDGTQLAFDTPEGIFAINISDAQVTHLIESREFNKANYPSWSPDGRYIAYVEAGADFGSVVVVKYDGTGKRYLTQISNPTQPSDADRKYGYLMWSPRGDYIAASQLPVWFNKSDRSLLEVVLIPVPNDLR